MLLGFWFILIWIIKWLNPAYYSAFNYETAQHYLELVTLTNGWQLLSGPLTSHPWLRLSSFPYYVFYPLFSLLRFHPLALPLTWVFVSAFTVILNWLVVKRWFSVSVAWISSALMVVTANWLYFDEHIGFYNFIIPLMYGFLWLVKEVDENKQPLWKPILLVSMMGCLHAASWMLLLVIGLLVWKKRQLHLKDGVALLVPQLPLLLNAFVEKNMGPAYFLGWIPYKIWLFVSSKPLGLNRAVVADTTFIDFATLFKQSGLPQSWSWIWGLVILVSLIVSCWRWRKTILIKRTYWWWVMLGLGLTALLIHRNPPFHYFVPLVMIPTVLLAVCLSLLPTWWRWLVVCMIVLINFPVWWSHTRIVNHQSQQNYKKIVEVTTNMIQEAEGVPFDINRIGSFDSYPGQAREQYDYMLWYLHHPVQPNAPLHFTIVDNDSTQTQIYKWSL